MIIHKTIMYTPFMAGVKHYMGYKSGDPDEHAKLINDVDFCGHLAAQKLPKSFTCPHWLRAWAELAHWKGQEIFDSDIAKSFLDMNYELTPKLIEQIDGSAHAKWIAQIHLDGTYGII